MKGRWAETCLHPLFLTCLRPVSGLSGQSLRSKKRDRKHTGTYSPKVDGGKMTVDLPGGKNIPTSREVVSQSVALASHQSCCSCENRLTAASDSAGVSHDINPVTQRKHTCKGSTACLRFPMQYDEPDLGQINLKTKWMDGWMG